MQLGVDGAGAPSRAQAWANGQLSSLPSATYSVSSSVVNNNEIQVTIRATTPSFFGTELPVGGFPTTVQSIAQAVSQAPLCVLVTATQAGDDMRLKNKSQMNANCLVYSNSDIKVDGGAELNAASTEVVTSAQGPITPTALTGAVAIDDPFGSVDTSFPTVCAGKDPTLIVSANTTMPPGVVIRSDVQVNPGITLTLAPGEQYFTYGSSPVPTPGGVGPRNARSTLVQ